MGNVFGYVRVSSIDQNEDRQLIVITASNAGTIMDCSVSGNISAKNYGDYVGAITGHNSGTISKSYNTANVTAYKYAGGMLNNHRSIFSNCALLLIKQHAQFYIRSLFFGYQQRKVTSFQQEPKQPFQKIQCLEK